jgi:hypothetical protein
MRGSQDGRLPLSGDGRATLSAKEKCIADGKWNAHSSFMKVAKKSPKRRPAKRATLTLPAEGYRTVDELRGDLSRSAYLHSLLEREKARRQREAFVARANAQCTEAFCSEAVRLNARLPAHGPA